MNKLLLALAMTLLVYPVLAASTLYSDSASGSVAIGTNVPTAGAALDIGSNTSSMLLPVGTTGQRPAGVNGMMRYNTTTPAVEAYVNNAWKTLSGTSGFTSCTQVNSTIAAASGTVSCTAGYTMTGGGCSSTLYPVLATQPSAADTWYCAFTSSAGSNAAYAICCQ